jgi:hypothetical protein
MCRQEDTDNEKKGYNGTEQRAKYGTSGVPGRELEMELRCMASIRPALGDGVSKHPR